jgi:hypothetical protein
MKARASKFIQFRTLVLTLLIVFVPFAGYYVYYVSRQKAYFTNRDFRSLEVMGNQITSKIENLGTVLINAASDADPKDVTDVTPTKPPATEAMSGQDRNENEKIKLKREDNLKAVISLVREGGTDLRLVGEPKVSEGSESDGRIRFSMGWEGSSSWLRFHVIGKPESFSQTTGAASKRVEFDARIDLDSLIRPLATHRGFDDVLLGEEKDGTVLFQDTISGLRIAALDNLVDKSGQGLPLKQPDVYRSSHRVQLGDVDYDLFVRPIRLSLSGNGVRSEPEEISLVLCGLVRSQRALSESLAVSYTVLVAFVFLVLMVILSWPFLKVRFMGPKDRLRVADVLLLGFSTLTGSALVTLFLLDLYTYTRLEATLDRQLSILSERITANFREEVRSALTELDSLSREQEKFILPGDDQGKVTPTDGDREKAIPLLRPPTGGQEKSECSQQSGLNYIKKTRILSGNIDYLKSPYPFLVSAEWMDKSGLQRIKLTIDDYTTPFICVRDRRYFDDVAKKRLSEIQYQDQEYRFSLEPIYSWNTGENLAVLSMPMRNRSEWVGSLDTRLLSLHQTSLPEGFGYTVIDIDGRVLFHVDQRRSLQENFFVECDQDHSLRSAVFGRRTEYINSRYLGRGHRLYVTPLSNSPWFLVVYRDNDTLRAANLGLLTVSMFLIVVYSMFPLGAIAIGFLIARDRAEWIWPISSRAKRYYQLFFIDALLCVAFCVVLLVTAASDTMYWSALFGLTGVILIFVALRSRKGFGEWKRFAGFLSRHFPVGWTRFRSDDDDRFRTGYTLAMLSSLTLMAILPSVTLFKMASDREMTLFIKYGQLTLAKSLKEREERAREQYKLISVGSVGVGVGMANFSTGPTAEVIRAGFLERRLVATPRPNDNWDIYSGFFFNTSARVISDNHPMHLTEEPAGLVWFVNKIYPLFDEASVHLGALTDNDSADGSRQWYRSRPDRLILHEGNGGSRGISVLHIESDLPGWLSADRSPVTLYLGAAAIWLLPVFALLLLSLLFLTLRYIARRVFLLGLRDPLGPYGHSLDSTTAQNIFVLVSPFVKKSGRWKQGNDFYVVDLRDEARSYGWASTYPYEKLSADRAVAIDYFEYGSDDVRANREKLRFIERLLVDGRAVVVLSALDLASYCVETPAYENVGRGKSAGDVVADGQRQGTPAEIDPQYADRWKAVLGCFLKVYLEDNVSSIGSSYRSIIYSHKSTPVHSPCEIVEDECAPREYLQTASKDIKEALRRPEFASVHPTYDQIISYVLDRVWTYYSAVWATCSQDEKLLLFYLAQDHFINSKSPEIPRLLRRGLIVRRPAPRPMNESFRRFILLAMRPDEIAAFEEEVATSTWNALKAPLLLVLVLAAVFLFLTQQRAFDSTIAIVTGATAVMPGLIKVIAELAAHRPGGFLGGVLR